MPKRRKGKHSSGRSTPSSTTPPPSAPASDEEEDDSQKHAEESASNDEEMKEELDSPKKEEKSVKPKEEEKEEKEIPLVLTSSEKRRGVYECDYCHSDISQLPRIRCAICPDFDLCLDCFSTTDHKAAIARLKAAANTHSELSKDGIESTMVTGISVSSQNGYPLSQGYKVCDSTRYPMFGPTKISSLKSLEENDQEQKSTQGAEEQGDEEKTSSPFDVLTMVDDPKVVWTVEEDLRLLDGIKTHGLGNWTEISEAVSGNGSTGKTPKRCMDRYLDDFLGRYGQILPAYTIIDDAVEDEVATPKPKENTNEGDQASKPEEEEAVRSSKRRVSALSRLPSNLGTASKSRKRYRVASTETLPEYKKLKLKPFLPAVEGVKIGQEVCRDQSKRAELEFVKATADVSTKEEAEKIKEEWIATRMNRPGAPTVLPPRPSDTALLPGADLLGFMPRRGDFDIEWENEAEQSIADMEFTQSDSPQERQLKVQVLEIYFQKQEERERRKNFIMTRKLYDYKKFLEDEEKIPVDERDLVQRLRLFERFHTPDEHKQFIEDIIKAKKLRKEIAKLQMYRRIGIRTLLEAEKYELDKERRQFHKVAQLQKDAEVKTTTTGTQATNTTTGDGATQTTVDSKPVDALWKQYKQNDRRGRRSMNRTISSLSDGGIPGTSEGKEEMKDEEKKEEETKEEVKTDGEEKVVEEKKEVEKNTDIEMDIDEKDTDTEMKDTEAESKARQKDESSTNEAHKNEAEFDISASKGYDLLSKREIQLCIRLKIYPVQYLEIKKALILESMKQGLLDNEAAGSTRRTIVKVDVEKRGNIIDFMVRAGWISTSLGKAACSLDSAEAVKN